MELEGCAGEALALRLRCCAGFLTPLERVWRVSVGVGFGMTGRAAAAANWSKRDCVDC